MLNQASMARTSPQKIAVLLSGGVDSSVALARLREQTDAELKAFYLKIWLEDDLAFLGECPWEDDLKYARAVCEHVGVTLEVISLQTEYWDRVVQYTISELKAGRTPSPDIFCNQRIKFGAFIDRLSGGFDRIASGHYVSLHRHMDGHVNLIQGVDRVKDQSYFLSHMSQRQLQSCEFPLGEFSKMEVREMAKGFNLPNQDRPDSQGICFLGKIKYSDFVKFHLGEQKGEIREHATGQMLGEHNGFWFHTVGQRKGLGLSGGPWFVTGKDIQRNIVFVSHDSSDQTAGSDRFLLSQPNWINQPPLPNRPYKCKVRHGAQMLDCTLTPLPNLDLFEVELGSRDRGLAPGQFCVIYDDSRCLGGGMIDQPTAN